MLPTLIADTLEQFFGQRDWQVTPLRGGDINRAVRLDRGTDALFLKWNEEAPEGLFAAEAEGLNALRRTGAIRVPEVVYVSESPAFLLMEYLPEVGIRNSGEFTAAFAQGLASLHRAAPDEPRFGFPTDNFLGVIPQRNQPRTADWVTFYRENRLLPEIERAKERNRLPLYRETMLRTLIDRLPNLMEGIPQEVSLLHGDLWSGNFLCLSGDVPALIDPAVYYGSRELEWAFIELFGGFPAGLRDAYQEAFPLDAGYSYRRSLHQLYYLLIHLNHFGETYGPPVERACREYL
ncbi:MAG: fructosamine kinase family protein [Armatimonadaceae bacterium]